MKVWIYYSRLAFLDLLRMRSSVQLHVLIVAGICLPILVLLGLKRGHVEELRRDLVTSPTGRQVRFWSAQRGEFLKPADVDRLARELGRVDLIIPEVQRLGTLARDDGGTERTADNVTFEATRRGDPILAALSADVLDPEEQAVVVVKSVAETLRVRVGDQVALTVSRAGATGIERVTTHLKIKAILAASSESGSIGYLDSRILDRIECYVRGGSVPQFGWPALRAPARDSYREYLLFSESRLTPEDDQMIRNRGYQIERVDDEEVRSLYGVLRPERLQVLHVHRLSSSRSRVDPLQTLTLSAREVAQMTGSDDVVVPWNPPLRCAIGGEYYRIVGLSLTNPSWLRGYMAHPELPFTFGTEERTVKLPESLPSRKDGNLPFDVDHRVRVDVKVISVGHRRAPAGEPSPLEAARARTESSLQEPDPGESDGTHAKLPLAIVPCEFLARITAYRNRTVDYDPGTGLFVPLPAEPSYDKARLYASTIDDVPPIVEELQRRNYAFLAEYTRVKEIHEQDASLQLLVYVVGAAVFGFGVVTVVSVLLDSTDRKRGTLGILRVMGVSRAGVFYLIFVRSIAIGLLAGAVTIGLGYAASCFLAWRPTSHPWIIAWKPDARAAIGRVDIVLVFLGSTLCCILGALYPAWHASRMDPFEAIVEGRFR